MSQRKLPTPIYTRAPSAIVDVTHRYPFRIEMRGYLGLLSAPPRFEFLNGLGVEFMLHSAIGYKEVNKFEDSIALWAYRNWRRDDPDPEWPHRAIFRVLDLLSDKLDKDREQEKIEFDKKRAEWRAAHPGSGTN